MTKQHRATPEQWETVNNEATDGPSGLIYSCLVELFDRVEALEVKAATQSLRGFGPNPESDLVKRVARAIHPSIYSDPNLSLDEAHDAIAEIADYLDSCEYCASAASQLRMQLKTQS
jgi:hypothetical protein